MWVCFNPQPNNKLQQQTNLNHRCCHNIRLVKRLLFLITHLYCKTTSGWVKRGNRLNHRTNGIHQWLVLKPRRRSQLVWYSCVVSRAFFSFCCHSCVVINCPTNAREAWSNKDLHIKKIAWNIEHIWEIQKNQGSSLHTTTQSNSAPRRGAKKMGIGNGLNKGVKSYIDHENRSVKMCIWHGVVLRKQWDLITVWLLLKYPKQELVP